MTYSLVSKKRSSPKYNSDILASPSASKNEKKCNNNYSVPEEFQICPDLFQTGLGAGATLYLHKMKIENAFAVLS